MTTVEALVVLSLGWLGFAYAGYPLILLALCRLSPRPVARGDVNTSLSVVISVHDGGRELRAKLESVLSQDYPGKLEVIVSSDGSTDDTVAVARSFAERGVVTLECAERGGKEAAQARALRIARGDLIAMVDVGGELAPGALSSIVRPFADPAVGCVSSEDEVAGETGGEGAYVRYEMLLRRLESECATLVGVSGSFFAFRRELADGWRHDLASDFRTALEAARRGLRAVSEPSARARFRTAEGGFEAEWQRKVRTVRRGLAVLSAYTDLLHPRHGRAALALWGHKIARFTSPFALLVVFVASLAGRSNPWVAALLAAQLVSYGLAGAGLLLPALRRWPLPRFASFFALVNASMLVAWIHHLRGSRITLWQPTRR